MDQRKVILYALASQERLRRSAGFPYGFLQLQGLQGHVVVFQYVARTDLHDSSLLKEAI